MTLPNTVRASSQLPAAIICARLKVEALAALDNSRVAALLRQPDVDIAMRMTAHPRFVSRLVELARIRYALPSIDAVWRARNLVERDRISIERRVGLACVVRSLGAALPRATVQAMTQRFGRDDMTFALTHAPLARRIDPSPSTDTDAVSQLGRTVLAESCDPGETLMAQWRGVQATASDVDALVALACREAEAGS